MKKLLSIMMALIMVFCLAACGNDTEPTTNTPPAEEMTTGGTSDEEPSDQTNDFPGAVLTFEEVKDNGAVTIVWTLTLRVDGTFLLEENNPFAGVSEHAGTSYTVNGDTVTCNGLEPFDMSDIFNTDSFTATFNEQFFAPEGYELAEPVSDHLSDYQTVPGTYEYEAYKADMDFSIYWTLVLKEDGTFTLTEDNSIMGNLEEHEGASYEVDGDIVSLHGLDPFGMDDIFKKSDVVVICAEDMTFIPKEALSDDSGSGSGEAASIADGYIFNDVKDGGMMTIVWSLELNDDGTFTLTEDNPFAGANTHNGTSYTIDGDMITLEGLEPFEMSDIFNVDFGPSCIQRFHPDKRWDTEISEDCLYLNVYTPADNADEKLPVMFWIHGGGFTGGSSADPEMSGEHLAQKGVVVVTINYRCGAMGFLALPEIEKKNGRAVNAGLLDQIAALRWVNNNIEAFGGDPERILVFGQSSGGMSTRMLLTSPLSRGLFSRAIIESGGGLNEADPIRPKQEFISLCQRAMEHLGWNYEDMMTLDALEINEKMIQAARETVVTDEVGYFQPFIDEYSITEVPGKLISKGEYMDIPIICGTVAGDSWMFSRKVRDQLKEQNYFRGFSYAASQAWARLQAEKGRTPIYTFYMDRKQPPREMKGFRRGAPPYGADTPHGTEVAYVFGTLNVRNQSYSPLDYEMSDVIGDYWTNFAKYGNPNGEGIVQWPRYTEETPYAMHFGNDGWKAENIVLSKEEEETLAYTKEHPGLLTSFQSNIPR